MVISTLADIKAAETSDLLATYNEITKKNIKKFASRAAAESQTWKAIQSLPPEEETKTKKQKSSQFGKRASADSRIIELLVKENPKQETSRAYKKFGILMKFEGKTVGEFRAQEGKHPELDIEKGWPSTELRWGINLKLIKLHKAESESKAA